jgi:hypothetical protein
MSEQEEVKMADYSNLYASESKFLKADDLKGRAIKVKISDAKVEPMTQDPSGDQKLVIYFEGKEKGMALNKTNFKVLASSFGPDTDEWLGKEIEVFSMDVEYQGKLVPGLRLRIVAAPIDGTDFDDDIPF